MGVPSLSTGHHRWWTDDGPDDMFSVRSVKDIRSDDILYRLISYFQELQQRVFNVVGDFFSEALLVRRPPSVVRRCCCCC